jgi:hypothetical protein
MRLAQALLIVLAFAGVARADSTSETVNIAITETTILNDPPGYWYNTGIPLTFESGNEVLAIAINWVDTGTPNFPFPTINGADDAVTLNGLDMGSVCNYLTQTGPTSFSAVDCADLSSSPYSTSVAYSGSWGTVEIGYGGSEPITINSSFTSQTIVPEPSTLQLLLSVMLFACLVGIVWLVRLVWQDLKSSQREGKEREDAGWGRW